MITWFMIEDAIEVLERLPTTVKRKIEKRELSYRQAAKQIGITAGHLHNIVTKTKQPTLPIIVALLKWMED